jgi:hypothetical protein
MKGMFAAEYRNARAVLPVTVAAASRQQLTLVK